MSRRRPEASWRRQTAYHEAGHAVVGWALGGRVGWLRLDSPGNGTGDIAMPEGASPIDRLAVCFAGYRAGNMCGEPHRRISKRTTDRVKAENIVLRDYPDDDAAQNRALAGGRRLASRLLTRHWAQVERVARELDSLGALNVGVVDAMLGPAAQPDADAGPAR